MRKSNKFKFGWGERAACASLGVRFIQELWALEKGSFISSSLAVIADHRNVEQPKFHPLNPFTLHRTFLLRGGEGGGQQGDKLGSQNDSEASLLSSR